MRHRGELFNPLPDSYESIVESLSAKVLIQIANIVD